MSRIPKNTITAPRTMSQIFDGRMKAPMVTAPKITSMIPNSSASPLRQGLEGRDGLQGFPGFPPPIFPMALSSPAAHNNTARCLSYAGGRKMCYSFRK